MHHIVYLISIYSNLSLVGSPLPFLCRVNRSIPGVDSSRVNYLIARHSWLTDNRY